MRREFLDTEITYLPAPEHYALTLGVWACSEGRDHLSPRREYWDEAMLSAALFFLREELGIAEIWIAYPAIERLPETDQPQPCTARLAL